MSSILILLLGLLLIFLEFFLPGAILGSIGAVFVVASMVLYGMEGHSALAVLTFVVSGFVGVGLVCWAALVAVRRSKGSMTFYSNADQEGYVAVEYDQTAVGKVATALTDLKPSGHIIIAGRRHQAISQSGYVEKDSKVLVIGGQGAYLLVKSTTA